MAFLTLDDYRAVVKDNVLTQIIQNDMPTRERAEQMAEAQLVSYLSSRYDTAAIFAATGTARNQAVVLYYLDLVLYHLHARISPEQVPELRKERYDLAIRWCEQVSKQMINPALPEPDPNDREEVLYNSNPKRSHHF